MDSEGAWAQAGRGMRARELQGGSRPAKAASTGSTGSRVATMSAAEAQRLATYRGATREAATAAYHADARVMVRMGYAPRSEQWSTLTEHVITVGYVHAPELGPAVLDALAQPEEGPPAESPPPSVPERGAGERLRDLVAHVPLEVKIAVGSLTGTALAVAAGILVAALAGQPADTIGLVGFGLLGMLIGAFLGMAGD